MGLKIAKTIDANHWAFFSLRKTSVFRTVALYASIFFWVAILVVFSGCGVDDTSVSSGISDVPVLDATRSYSSGDVDITEQVFRTRGSNSEKYRLNANFVNRGADLERAVYEMVTRVEFPTGNLGELNLGPETVSQRFSIGTLKTAQEILVSLDHEGFGGQLVRVEGRLVQDADPEEEQGVLPL